MDDHSKQQFSIKGHEDKYGSVGLSESAEGVYVWPYCGGTKKSSWIMYVFPNGEAHLYLKRSDTGALLGKPIKLPTPTFSQYRCQVLLPMGGGVDVIGAMLDKFKSKNSRPCGLPATRLALPTEVTDDPKAKPIWICPGHDEYTK